MRLHVLAALVVVSVLGLVVNAQSKNSGSKINTTARIKAKGSPDLEQNFNNGSVDVISNSSGSTEKSNIITKKFPVSVLLGRPINASTSSRNDDNWVAAIIETGLHYKLTAVSKIKLINSDTIRAHIPAHGNFSRIVEDADYLAFGKKLKADYIVIQKFEVTRSKEVFFYLEIISVSSQEVVTTIERTFKLRALGKELDAIIEQILTVFTISPPPELARFLRIPVIGTNVRVNKTLGDCIIRDRFSQAVDSMKLADDYRALCEKERDLPIAYYRAGFFFSAVGRHNDAAEAFNMLFRSIPEYTPTYIPLAKALRMAKREQDAIRIAELAEKRGINSSELIAQKALAYLSLGKTREAENVYRQILKKNPDDPYALMFYARLNNDEKKPKSALIYIDKLLKLKELSGNAYLEKGRSLYLLHEYTDAITALKKATRLLPNDIEPVLFLGDSYLAVKKYSKAYELFNGALKKSSDKIDLYLKAAYAADKSGNKQKALTILKGIETRFSNHGGLQKEMGLLELANGDSSSAKVHLEASMRSGIKDERVITGLGWIYLSTGNYAKAELLFKQALTMVKDKNRCKVGLATAYIKNGQTAKAVTLIREVSAAKVAIPGLNAMLGDAMKAKGDKKSALIYYRKERSAGANDKVLQKKIAQLSYSLESAKTARSEYQTLIKGVTPDAEALYRLAILSLRLKSLSGAEKYLSQAKKTGDTDGATWMEIGKEYTVLRKTKNALDAYSRSAQKTPNNEKVWNAIAVLQAKLGNDSATAEAYLKLYGINNEKYSKKLASAGRLFEKAGLKTRAKQAYSTFIRNNHKDSNVNIRLALMEYEEKNCAAVITLLKSVPAITLGSTYGKVLVQCYMDKKSYEAALPLIKFILTKKPKDKQVLEWAAYAHEMQKDYNEAIKMYKKYLMYAGKHTNYAYHIGELLESVNKRTAAIAQYRANIRLYPSDQRNYNRLAELYIEMKSWKSAIYMLEKLLTFEAASPRILGSLAKANMALGRKTQAMKYLNDYIKSAPNDSAAWYDLGMLYYNSKQYKKAAEALERASTLMKRPSSEVYTLIGNAFLMIADTSKAIDNYERARSGDKTNSTLLTTLVDCYRATGNERKLVASLEDKLRLDAENNDIRLELADLYLKNEKYSDATKLIEAALSKKGCDAALHLKIALVYKNQKNNKRRVDHLKKAAKCDPKNAEVYYEIGLYFVEQKNTLKAERYLKKALRINKRLAPANYMLGSMLLERNAFKSACVYLSRALAVEPENNAYRMALTKAYYEQRQYRNAFKVIGPIIKSEKIPSDALGIIGLLYKAIGKSDTARQILNNAVEENKNCVECYVALGDLYFEEDDYSRAVDYYKDASHVQGFSKKGKFRLAECYRKLGRSNNAKELYQKIVADYPGEGEAQFRLIQIYLKKGLVGAASNVLSRHGFNKDGWYYLSNAVLAEVKNDTNTAMTSYSKALNLLPDMPEIQAGCARISLAKKRYSAAIKYFGQAMAGDPTNIDLMYGMAEAYAGQKNYSTALELYEEVVRQKPDYPNAHYSMAKIYRYKKEYDYATEMLERAAKLDKKNYQIFYILGRTYQRVGESKAAIENYTKALKINETKSLEAYRYIGNIYYRKGNEKKAKKYYATYIKLGGKNKGVQRYMRAK